MKKKFKGSVYRAAIQKLDESGGFACIALGLDSDYSKRFSTFFGATSGQRWTFERVEIHIPGLVHRDSEFEKNPHWSRLTREIALELAAHLEDIGEMDRILKK